jgi:hypothetical protein
MSTNGFPDGAPVDACVKPRPNQPYHGQARPQPLSTNPYQLIASSGFYEPGSQITGKSVPFDASLTLSFHDDAGRFYVPLYISIPNFYLGNEQELGR